MHDEATQSNPPSPPQADRPFEVLRGGAKPLRREPLMPLTTQRIVRFQALHIAEERGKRSQARLETPPSSAASWRNILL